MQKDNPSGIILLLVSCLVIRMLLFVRLFAGRHSVPSGEHLVLQWLQSQVFALLQTGMNRSVAFVFIKA